MSNFAYAFFLLPKAKRQALTAFYRFCRKLDDIVDGDLSPFAATAELEDWRNEIERLYQGYPTKAEAIDLMPLVDNYPIPPDHLHAIIDGVAMDLTIKAYDDFDALRLYCHRVASVVGLVAIEIFGYKNPSAITFAESLGIALQLTNIIRDVGEDIDRKRLYIPLDELARFGLTPTDIAERIESPAFSALMAYQADRAETFYREAALALAPEDKANLAPAVAMGRIYHALLEKLIRQGFPVLQRRVGLSGMHRATIVATTWLSCRL